MRRAYYASLIRFDKMEQMSVRRANGKLRDANSKAIVWPVQFVGSGKLLPSSTFGPNDMNLFVELSSKLDHIAGPAKSLRVFAVPDCD